MTSKDSDKVAITCCTMNVTIDPRGDIPYDYDGSVLYVVVVLMVFSFSILAFMASMIRKTQREEESVDDYLKNKANIYQEMRILQTNRTHNFLMKRKMQQLLREKMRNDFSSTSLAGCESQYSIDDSRPTSTRDTSEMDLSRLALAASTAQLRPTVSRDQLTDRLLPPIVAVTSTDGRTEVKYHSFTDVTLL